MTILIDSAPTRGARNQGAPQDKTRQGQHESEVAQAGSSAKSASGTRAVRRVLQAHAFLISLLVSVPAVFVLMLINNTNALYKDVAASLVAGDLKTFLVVATGVLYALLSSLTVAYIRAEERDKFADHRQSEMIGKMNEMDINTRMALATLDRLESQKRAVTFTGPNIPARWKPLYPRSTYWTVNPFGRFDFIDEPQVDGSVMRVPDWQRLGEIYVPRFEELTKLRCYNIVVFARQAGKSSVPEQIKYVLNLFRAVEFAARVAGISVDLNIVRLYVRDGAEAQVSFFVGEMEINGRSVPFSNQYVSMTKSFNVGRIVLDDRVITTFDQAEVDVFRSTAEQLCYGVPALTIQEAEARWGHLLPRENWQHREVSAVVKPRVPADGIIDFGDGSFLIP